MLIGTENSLHVELSPLNAGFLPANYSQRYPLRELYRRHPGGLGLDEFTAIVEYWPSTVLGSHTHLTLFGHLDNYVVVFSPAV
jgi:hypothetical protein